MMCYKDKRFCPYWEECKIGKDCHRALTNKVIEDAEKWMKGALIDRYITEPSCFIKKELK